MLPRCYLASALCLLCIATLSPAAEDLTPAAGEMVAGSVKVQLTGEEQEQVPLLLYTPKEYTSDSRWPLVLFLHGLGESGEGGDELERVKIHGPTKQIAAGRHFPFVLVAPQCPKPPNVEEALTAWRADLLTAVLDEIEADLPINDERIYVTGLSMGGFGSWRLACAQPERFAAVAPICGGGDPAKVTEKLATTPIWAFHGGNDDVVPVRHSIEMVDAVRAVNGNVRLTIYPDVNHGSWERTYDNPLFYDWLLGCRRASN